MYLEKTLSKPVSESNDTTFLLRIKKCLLPGLGGFIAILALAEVSAIYPIALLIAPFGASSVIAFALPNSPLARAKNLIGGHVLSASIGVIIYKTLGSSSFSIALAVGLAIVLMILTDTLHPPAGGNPILVITLKASWTFIASPVAAGACLVFLVALFYHRIINRTYAKG